MISKEIAEQEFSRWVDGMGLELFENLMDNDDIKDFTVQKARILKAIEKGALIVSDKNEFVYTPQRSEDAQPITFYEATGAALTSMDLKKKDRDMGKMFNAMASITQTVPKIFNDMKMPDLQVCIAITTLFLA